MAYFKYLLIAFCLGLLLFGCDLEKDITIDLPKHQSQLVVECYLEPGRKVQLLLTESSSYLDSLSSPFVNDALITVTYNNIVDTLFLNTQFEEGYKVYNYISNKIVPADFERDFFLYIKDSKGRTITGKTKLLQAVPIDTAEYKFNEDSLAYVLMSFEDDTTRENYYRLVVHKDSLTNVVQRFVFTDEFSETSKISVGTPYTFEKGKEAFLTLYHIDESYYKYVRSVDAARDGNSNPFAQPAMIMSNVGGGIGIFTGLAFDFRAVRIE
ncbi:MAG TPA: DUF4249 domain-containing protein [Cytophagales bacterium]|nr:DUF4249 domain-containing protein [Cytophagales bacterium]